MVLAFLVVAPWLCMPFLFAIMVKKSNSKRKLTYLVASIFVPLWPLILTFCGTFGEDGFVLVGTSVLAIPAALTFQKLANELIL